MPPKANQNKAKYSEGEKILCFHGPLLYEAKCLQVEQRDAQTKYFVHYQGWNKNWDEWVTDARMMKFNAVGLQKQKELKEFYSKPGKKVKGLRKSELKNQEYPPPEALRKLEENSAQGDEAPAAAKKPTTTTEEATRKPATEEPPPAPRRVGRPPSSHSSSEKREAPKRELAASVASDAGGVGNEASGGGGKRLRVHIELPRLLKLCLADDRDYVVSQRRLHTLPASAGHSVAGLLAKFVAQSPEAEREAAAEFSAGVQLYFNATLGSQLLYGFERPQLAALQRAHRSQQPAALYGCAHLLRLMLRLGDLLQHTKPDVKCLSSLLDHCDSLLAFIEKNLDSYVSPSHYEASTPEYQKLVAS